MTLFSRSQPIFSRPGTMPLFFLWPLTTFSQIMLFCFLLRLTHLTALILLHFSVLALLTSPLSLLPKNFSCLIWILSILPPLLELIWSMVDFLRSLPLSFHLILLSSLICPSKLTVFHLLGKILKLFPSSNRARKMTSTTTVLFRFFLSVPKSLKKSVSSQIYSYLNSNCLISNSQSGF